MHPILYVCCQIEDCQGYTEGDYRLRWSTVAPQLGTVIDMGAEARWCVVKVTVYRPKTPQAMASLYIAYVHPVDLPVPPESEWDNDLLLYDSVQSLHLKLVAIGKEELIIYTLEGLRPPKVGEQIDSDIDPMDEDIVIYKPPKLWTLRQAVPYLPVEEMRLLTPESAYHARAFVCWYEPTEERSGSSPLKDS